MTIISYSNDSLGKMKIDSSKGALWSSPIDEFMESLSAGSISRERTDSFRADASIEEKLFDALANFKVAASSVSMHLKDEWRRRFFAQLDSLLDCEEWDELDEPPSSDSFRTFLRLLLFLAPEKRPALGVSGTGEIIAAWTNQENRLTIECFPKDRIEWVLTRILDDETERAAGTSRVDRMKLVLSAFEPEIWFSNA